MGALSDDLKAMGYEPTGRESPFDEGGLLWTKGYELVCDETGIVIRKSERRRLDRNGDNTYRYRNSGKVKLPGGFVSNYDWGDSENGFRYTR